MCHHNSTLAVFITTSYRVSKVLFRHQTILDSTLLTKLRSSTKQGGHPQWSEDVYSSLKISRDGKHYYSNKRFKPLFLNILGNLPNYRFFHQNKGFYRFFRQIKGLKDFMQNIGF